MRLQLGAFGFPVLAALVVAWVLAFIVKVVVWVLYQGKYPPEDTAFGKFVGWCRLVTFLRPPP